MVYLRHTYYKMQNDKVKSHLHLHFLVFIAGFTAIIGELISIGAVSLVWYRMLIAGVLMFLYIRFRKFSLKISRKVLIQFLIAGGIIALHWITFFEAINQSNVSITLAMFSTGAFFASLIEPIIYQRKLIWYEILFGLIVVVGVVIITQNEYTYINGILLGISSAFFSSLFSVLNGKFVAKNTASVISFYEFIGGVVLVSLYIFFFGSGFTDNFFVLEKNDLIYLLVLGSICTAYAFIAATDIMKVLSPYTVVLTYNLEPLYGIFLALLFFPETEQMSVNFYIGTVIILLVVVFDAVLKRKAVGKEKK